ncbi:MAG: putative sulfate/molybdate transporter, partial [Pseudomonadota bacterium]
MSFDMEQRGERFVCNVRELSGALGDLGTLLPLTLGAIAVAGLAPTPVLVSFGLFYIATALVYRLPIPVQPMKAVAAVLL